MMVIETAVRQLLVSDSGVKALVKDRIYPQAAPQSITEAKPTDFKEFEVYSRAGGAAEHHMAASSGLAYAIVQLDSVSIDYTKAKEIAEANREALDGYQGTVTVGAETLTIDVLTIKNTRDGYIPPKDADDVGKHVISQDIEAGYQESVPTFS